MARKGHQWMAQLLRRPRRITRHQGFRVCDPVNAFAHPAQAFAKGPLQLVGSGSPDRLPLAKTRYPSPVARPATYRQYPRQEPRALTRMRGSARGDRGNPVSYRNRKFWAHLTVKSTLT